MDNKFDEDFMNKYADENKKTKKSDGYEDISSNSNKSKPHMLSEMTEKEKKRKSGKRKPLTKKKKAAIITIACILGVIVLGAAVVFGGALGIIGKIGNNVENDKFDEPEIAEEDLDALGKISDIVDAASLKELLKKWANSGNKNIMTSKNVVNILLMGLDARKDSESDSSRSDVMLLVSINKKMKKITFVSFLRDSYTYMKLDNGKEIYTKLNEAYYYGGPDLVIRCIENDYKINIDGYAAVNFETFPKVIDAVGGVDIEITDREAKYLNKSYGLGVSSGSNVHVNGKTALNFCRIRAIDSDNERTRRQRTVLTALAKKATSSSVKQINNMLNELLPYVDTNLKDTKILSLATQAITGNWINYEMGQLEMPGENERIGGYVGDKWFWIVDYPGSAVKLQNALYGTSNIPLPENRVTALDLFKGSSNKSSSSSSSSSSSKTVVPTTSQAEETTEEFIEETTKKQGLFPFIDDQREENTEAPAQEQEEPNTEKKEESTWWFENIVA